MKYREGGYYRFGLAAGLSGFVRNGFTPGFRVSASAVLQPINSYTRFPEFHFMEREVAALVEDRGADRPPLRILDVGSPKLFGFILARRYDVDLTTTDINPLNLDPYVPLWAPLRRRARGRVRFELRDARRLSDPDGSYDFVYAMSVVEHIEGTAGDAAAIREMVRVLKPGGRLAVSVPFGPVFKEQRTGRGDLRFFQRIYDPYSVEKHIREPLRGQIDGENLRTIDRRPSFALRAYHRLRGGLPESLMTALGGLNPLASAAFNRDRRGMVEPRIVAYGGFHRFGDIYGDLIFTARKKAGA
jgi:SAM-dependent methyltransferase